MSERTTGLVDAYAELVRAAGAGEAGAREAAVLSISGAHPPWTDSGIDLAAGEHVTILASGRVTLSEELGVALPPRTWLWRRIGDKGPIFKGARDTATHPVAASGRLQLAVGSRFWATPDGDYLGSDEEFVGLPGGYEVVVIRWERQADPLAGLRTLQLHAPADPLLAAEIERLASPAVEIPDGWEYFWRIGESESFSAGSDGARALIRARPVDDAAILKRPLSLDLRPDTRLRWRWKIDALPSQVAENQLHTHDYLSIAVEYDNGQDLTYYWSAALPEGTIYRCPLPGWSECETHQVIRSGPDGVGRWFAEERTLQADYRVALGDPPGRIVGVWLIAVSLFSHSRGAADFAEIEIESGGERLQIL